MSTAGDDANRTDRATFHPVPDAATRDALEKKDRHEDYLLYLEKVGGCRCWELWNTTVAATPEQNSTLEKRIAREFHEAMYELNFIVEDLQGHANGTGFRARVGEFIEDYLTVIRKAFQSMALYIVRSPGYVCPAGSTDHDASFRKRERKLRAQVWVSEVRARLALAVSQISYHQLFRVAAFAVLPFSLFVSSTFSALSVVLVGYDAIMGIMSPVRAVLMHMDVAHREWVAEQELAWPRARLEELRAQRRSVEELRRGPRALWLVDMLAAAQRVVEEARALHAEPPCADESAGVPRLKAGSLPALVEAVREVEKVAQLGPLMFGTAATVSVQECMELNRILVGLRTCGS